uniref:Uncharacterized protein n=1 Tax=Odontella aurita TaxID=265563 RepID=A0A6U6EJ38_9STRA|mmetsp:Transcript_26990/g.79745  ORF Transcript_26990/g.79745 Transcript_26990/m.79745 type:complete len:547 (+) Transcript_26990:262-1902(+)
MDSHCNKESTPLRSSPDRVSVAGADGADAPAARVHRATRWGGRPVACDLDSGEQGRQVDVAEAGGLSPNESNEEGNKQSARVDEAVDRTCGDAMDPLPNLLPGILARLSDPTIVKSVEHHEPLVGESADEPKTLHLSREEAWALPHVPWEFRPHPNGLGTKKDYGNSVPHDERGNTTNDVRSASSPGDVPTYSYLDLRAAQNTAWATSRLHAGVKYAKISTPASQRKAEVCYKEGLDLAPSHPELLVAYGALCANAGRLEEAKESLGRALQVTGGSGKAGENAKEYLEAVERKLLSATAANETSMAGHGQHSSSVGDRQHLGKVSRTTKTKRGLVSKTEYAMRDVLAERAFLSGEAVPTGTCDDAVAGEDQKYPLLEDPAIAAARAAMQVENNGEKEVSISTSDKYNKEKYRNNRRDKGSERKRDRKKRGRSHRKEGHRHRHKSRRQKKSTRRKRRSKRRRKGRDDDSSLSSEHSPNDKLSDGDHSTKRDRNGRRRHRSNDYSSSSESDSSDSSSSSDSSHSSDFSHRGKHRHRRSHRRKSRRKSG